MKSDNTAGRFTLRNILLTSKLSHASRHFPASNNRNLYSISDLAMYPLYVEYDLTLSCVIIFQTIINNFINSFCSSVFECDTVLILCNILLIIILVRPIIATGIFSTCCTDILSISNIDGNDISCIPSTCLVLSLCNISATKLILLLSHSVKPLIVSVSIIALLH